MARTVCVSRSQEDVPKSTQVAYHPGDQMPLEEDNIVEEASSFFLSTPLNSGFKLQSTAHR